MSYAWKQTFPDYPIFGAGWIIDAPWAHPIWSQYQLVLYDLTSPSAEHGEPKILLPGATHEFMLWALDPDKPIKRDTQPELGKLVRLQPPNYAYQFKAESDAAAEARLQRLVDRIAAREVSPDTDFRSFWNSHLFSDAYPLVQ